MKVFVVGNGCTWFTRNDTSFIIDDKILLDTPTGSYKDILKHIDIFKLEAIIISHFHADHFGDFRIFATRFMRESEYQGRTQKLKVFGPVGILDKLIAHNTLMCGSEDERDKNNLKKHIEFVELVDGDEFDVLGYHVQALSVDHGKVPCLAFLFTDENNKKIAFSGDTKECDALIDILKKSDVAFVDMAATELSRSHLDTESFVRLQEKYINCKMFPIHMSDGSLMFAKENGLHVLNDFDEIIF